MYTECQRPRRGQTILTLLSLPTTQIAASFQQLVHAPCRYQDPGCGFHTKAGASDVLRDPSASAGLPMTQTRGSRVRREEMVLTRSSYTISVLEWMPLRLKLEGGARMSRQTKAPGRDRRAEVELTRRPASLKGRCQRGETWRWTWIQPRKGGIRTDVQNW